MDHKLAVLVSGSGTLLDAIVEDGIPVELVIADRDCPGLKKAKAYGVEAVLVERTFGEAFDREAYTRQILEILLEKEITFVSMAGWMTVFTQAIFDRYPKQVINNHPALLPSFVGDNAVADALAYGVKVTGCTIHVATQRLDDGPILAQAAVRVLPGDTEETLHNRIKVAERKLLPLVLRKQLGLPPWLEGE